MPEKLGSGENWSDFWCGSIIGKTCYHAELLIVIFFICRNISQYVVFEKVNEKLQLLVEKLHSPLTAVPTYSGT